MDWSGGMDYGILCTVDGTIEHCFHPSPLCHTSEDYKYIRLLAMYRTLMLKLIKIINIHVTFDPRIQRGHMNSAPMQARL